MSDSADKNETDPYVSESCCICDRRFSSDLKLAKHLLGHTKEEEFKTLISELEEKTKPLASSFTRSGNVSYKSKSVNKKSNTEVCEIVIDDSDDERSSSQKPTIQLPNANPKFGNSSTKKDVASSNYSFRCPTCLEPFDSDDKLKAHVVLHEKPRPYSCQFCNKSFSYMGRYRAHMQLHANEKRHK